MKLIENNLDHTSPTKKKSYLEICQSSFWQTVFEKELEYLLRKLKSYDKVLSVGCGPAVIERGLQENGFEVVGLDVSKEALDETPDNIRTVVGTAEDMDFPDSSFDATIYVASMQFIDNYRKAVKETARVLSRDGKLVAMLLNPESEFFKQQTRNADSYMNKIKHRGLGSIERVIGKHFSVKTEYYLGIRGKEIFESNDPKLASLYIVEGVKR